MTTNTDKARKVKPKQSRRRKRRATLADLRDIDILRPIPETEEDDNEDEQAKWESRPRLRRCSSLEIFSLSREIFGNDIRKTAGKDFEDTCKDNTEVVRPTSKTADNRQALNQLPAEADFALNQLSPVEIEGKETKSDKVTILNKQSDICDPLGRMRDGQTETDVMTLVFSNAEQDQCQTMDLDQNAQSKHDSRDFPIQVDTKAAPEIRLENAPSVFRGRRSGAAPDPVNKDVIAASTNSSGEEDNDESESDSETASIKSAVSNYELTNDINENDDPDLANRVNIANNDCKSQWDEPGNDALSLPDDDELSKDARTPTGMSNSSSDNDLDPRKLSELLKKAHGSMRRRSSMSDIYSYYVSTLPSIVERSRKSSIASRKSSFVNLEQFQYNSEGSTSSFESNCREKSLAQVNGKSSVYFKTICTSPGILKRRMSLGDVLNSLAPRPESAPPITTLENTSRDNQYVPQLDQKEHKPANQVKSTVLPSQKQSLVDTLKKKVKATLRRRNSIASTKPWTGTLETSLSQSLDLHGSREMELDSQPCQENINLEIPLCHTEGYRRKIATNHHPAVHGESDKADLKINTETTDDNKMTNRVKTKEESLGTSPRRSSIGGSTPTSKPSNNNHQGTKASYTNDQGTKSQPEKLSLPSNYSLNTQNRVNDPKKVEHETKRQPVKAPLTRSNSFNTPNRSNNPRRIEPKPKQQPFKSPLTRSHSLNTQKQRKHSEKLDTTDVGVETSLGKLDKTKKAAKTCAVNLVRRLTLDIGRRAAKARPDSKNEVLSSRDNEGLKNTQKELNKSSKYESSRDVLRDDKVTETNGNIKSSTSPKSGVPPSEEVERNKYSPNVGMTKSQKESNEAQLFTPKYVHNISGKEKAKNARAPDNRQKTDQLNNDRKPSVTIMRPRSPFSFSVSTNLLAERQNIQQLPTLRDKIEKREDLEENTKSEEGSILIKNTPQTEQALKGLNVKDKELNDELEVFSDMLGELEQIPLNKNNVTPNSTTITQKTSLKENPKTLPETGLSSPRSSLPTDQRFAALSERYAAIMARVGLSTGVISGQGAVKREVEAGIENEGTMSDSNLNSTRLISPVAKASSLFAAISTPPSKNVGRLSPPSESITLDINNNNVTGEVHDSNVVSFQEIESNLGRSDKMSLAKVAEPIPRSITHSLQAVDAVHVKKGHILSRSDKMEGNGNKGEPMQIGQVKDPKIVMDLMTADSSTIATEVQKSSASGLSLTMFLEQPRKTVVSRFIHHKMAKKTPFIYTRVSVVFSEAEARISRVPDTMPEFTRCRAYIERVTLKSSIKPEALSIRQLLKGLGPLLEMELLAVCKESIKTLRTLDALGSLPSYISLDTIMVNPSGTVEFKQLNSGVTVDELFLAPEYTNSFSIDKTCVFGLAVTIWLAADWKLTEAQRPLLSRCFLELLWCMLEDDVTARPSLDGVLQKCESLHEEGHMSSRERCQALLWEYQAHAVISSQQESRIAGDSNSIKSRHTAVMGSITVAGNIKGFLRQTKAPKERNIFTKPQRKTESIDTTPEVPTTTNAREISHEVANLTNSPSEVRPQSPALGSIPQPSTPVVFTTVPQVSGAAMAMSPGTVSPQVHAPAFVPIPVPVGSSPLWYMTPQGMVPYQQIPPTGFFMPVDASVGSVASSESEMGDVEEARPLQVRPRQRTSSGEGERSPEIRNRASPVMKSRIPRPVAEPRRRISQPSRPSDDDFSPPVRRRAHTNAHKNNPHSLRARTPPPSFQKASHSSGTPRSQTPPVRWRRKSLNDSDDEQSRHRSYSNPSSSHPRSNHSALGSRSRPSSPGQQDQSPRPGRSRVNSPSRDSRRSSGGSRPPSPVKSRSSSPVLDLISKFEKLSSDPAGESKSVTTLLNKFGSSSLLSEDRLEKKQFKAHRDPNRAKAGPLRPSSAMEQTSELRAPPGGSLSRSWPMNRNPAQGESTGDEDSPYVSKDSYISSPERNPRDHRHRTGSSSDGERSLSNKSRELQAYLGKGEREKYLREKEEVSLSVSRQRTWSSLENLNNAVDYIGSMNNAIMRKSSSMENFSQRDQPPVRTKGISTSYERVDKAGEYGTRLTIHSTKKDKHHGDSKQDRLNWSDIQFEPVRDSNKGITSITSPKIPVGLAVKDNRSENAALFTVEPSRTGPFSPSLFSPSAVQGSMFPFHHPVKLERSNTPLSPPASLSPSLKECKPTNYFSNVSFDQEKPENDILMAKTPEKKTWGEEHNQIRIEAMSSLGGSSADNSGVRSDRASSTGSGSDRRRKSSCDSASSDTVFTSNIGGNPDYLKRFEMRISRTSSSGSAGEVEPDSSRLRADSGSASSNGYHSKSQSILDGTTPTVEKARPPSLALSHDDTKYETTPRKDGLNPSGNPHLFETQKDQGRRKARPVSLVLSPGEESSSMHTPIAQPCGDYPDSRPRSKKPASQPTTPTVKPDQSSRRQSTPNALQSSKGSKDVGDRIDKSYTKSLVPRDQLNTGRPASPSLTKFREQMAKRASRPNSPSSSTRTHADSDDVFDFPTVDDKVGRSNSRGATLPENENKEEFVERFVHDTSLQMQSSTSNFKKSTSMGNLNRNPQEESRAKRKISDTVVSRSAAIVEKTSSGFYKGPDSNDVSNPVTYSKTKNPLVEKLNLSSFTGSSTRGAVSPTSSSSTASLSPTSRLPINQFMFYKPQNESSNGKQSLKGAGVVITDTSRQRVDKKVESREVNGKGDQGDDKKTRGTREDDKERRKENKPALQQKETEISKICAAHSETVSAIFNAARRASLTPRNDSDESDSSKERVDLDPKNTGLKYTKPLRKDNNKVSTDHELSPTFAQSTSSTPKSVTDKPNQTSDRPMSRNSNSSSSRRSSLTPRNDSNGSNTSRYQPGSHLSKSSSPRRYSLTPRHDSNSSNTSEGRPESQLSNVSSPRRSSLTPRRNSGTPESLDRSMSPHDKSRSSSALSDEGFNALIKSVRRRSLTPQNDSDRSTDSLERSMSPESRIANALAKRPPSPGRVDSKDLLGHLVKKVLTSAAAKQGSGSDQVSIVDPDTPRSKTKRRPSPGPIESSVKRSEKSTPKRSPSPAAGKQRGDEAKGRSTPVQTPRRGSQDNRPAENSQYTENTPRKDEGQQKKEEIKASIVTNQLNAAQDVSNGDEKTRSARASQPKMAGACAEQDVLSKLVDMIHEEFAFDGYLDDGVEDVNMAEYIMSLSGMNEEMFKEAVSDQYGDLYWDDDLLEEMYLVVTKGQQTRRPTLQFSESTVSDYSLSESVLSRDGSVSEPGTGYLNSLSRTSSDRSSVEIRDYVLLSLGEPSEFLPFRVIAPDTIRDINDELVPLFDDYHKVMKVKLSPSINELTERLGAKILEISQQLTLERKAKRKNVTSFNKVADIDHKKDVKDLAANLLREIEESDRKIIYLKYIQRRLRNIYAERFGLNHTLLFSFATSYGADDVMLEPSQQNNLLSFSPLWDQRGADMSDAHGESTRGPMLQYGTMLGLFSYLFGRFAMSQAYVRYFLYTYRYCATPSDLFNFIRDKCRASLRAADSESGQPLSHQLQIRYRALDILAEWIDSCYRFDFKPDPGLLGQLVAFIQEEFVPVDRTERGAMLLELISERHRKEEDEDAEETPDTMAVLQAELPQGAPSIMDAARKLTPRRKSKPTVQCFKRGSPQAASFYKPTANLKAMSVTDHSSRTVAQQLTLIQQELFTRSHSIHFLNSRTLGVGVGRSSPTKEGSSLMDNMLGFSAGKRRGSLLPNEPTDLSSSGEHNLFAGSCNMDGSLEAMLEHAQDVSMWVAVEICSAASVKSQLVLVTKFVSIAKHCAEMRNFATCVQIIDALEMFVIKQLPVWKQVPNKVIQSLEELKAIKVLLKTDSLWLLRDHAVREKPTIPCTLLFLMHIQQQEIGGFTLANGMFKWTKMRSIGRLVDQIRLFKQMRYAFEANDSMKEHLVQRILECRDLNLHTLASENTANFHLSSSQNSRKFQDAFKKMKATFGHG
ncbi:uncharacterized protein LOC5521079 isoform X2 [Nematostella vectensis]|uniref:uncharacterized protein LOC5521079 isoform X2 n=1 Tax=Nematostella vectensis TaxID=45351 RepID=UPI002076DC7D|nr:uncharacterized protein LOC5521079 isoform X2 [Nematostella vectensis]